MIAGFLSAGGSVADVCMAADAIELTCVAHACACENQLADQTLVTACTVVVQHFFVVRTNADGLGKILQGEAFGMPKSVFCFGNIFREKPSGRMALITGGHCVMAGLLPAIVLLVHDVAVHANLGVFGKIGKRLGSREEISADPDQCA